MENQVLWFCERKAEAEKVRPKELYPPKNRGSVGMTVGLVELPEPLKPESCGLCGEVEEVIVRGLEERHF